MLRFLRWFSPPSDALLVDGGRVFCPRAQADVEVDSCLRCPHLATFVCDEAQQLTEIVCRRPPVRVWDAAGFTHLSN